MKEEEFLISSNFSMITLGGFLLNHNIKNTEKKKCKPGIFATLLVVWRQGKKYHILFEAIRRHSFLPNKMQMLS